MDSTGGTPVGSGSDGARWWTTFALAGGAVAFVYAYRALLTLGPRYDVTSGVEYWLFVPNDRAPVIVLALSGWLAYRRWPRLRQLPLATAPTPAIATAFALGAAVYLWSVWVRAEDLLAISLIFNASGLVLLRWGLPGLRVMWLPIAFLLFCVPVPSPLLVRVLWELRLMTADYAGWLLYLVGIPVFVSGDQILRAAESFQVVEGCSGMRSVETLTMLVVLLVDLFHRRGWHAAALLLSAPFVAFALNGVRVLTLTLNPHSEIVTIHSLQGIAILLLGLLTIYALDGALAHLRSRLGGDAEPAKGRGHPTPAARAPVAPRVFAGVALAVGLATGAAAAWAPVWSEPRPKRALVAAVDEALAPWRHEELEEDTYFHGRMFFREKVHRSYATRGAPVEVFLGLADLRDRRTSIASWVTAMPGSGWSVRDVKDVVLEPGGQPAREFIVEKGTERRLVVHRLVGVESLWIETLRSFLGLDRSDFRRTTGQLAMRLSTRLDASLLQGPERARHRVQRIYADLEPVIRDVVETRGAN